MMSIGAWRILRPGIRVDDNLAVTYACVMVAY
jgi:hypothetical protein